LKHATEQADRDKQHKEALAAENAIINELKQ